MVARLPFASVRATRFAVSTALVAGLLTGCGAAGVQPGKLASSAQTALGKGNAASAIDNAEKAVLADPRNPAYRVLLGNAYLKAGRFESARQAYDEAMELGEDTSRTALSLALADLALGRNAEAVDTLNSYRDSIEPSDYGLALALAGQPAQGIAVLTEALRGGENTSKIRQNLALAYALDGRWREARTMAAQDVPADRLGERMEQWALLGFAQDGRGRIAGLLSVPLRADQGQPAALALANFPTVDQMAAEASGRAEPAAAAPALAEAAVRELPALDAPAAPGPLLADASSQLRQEQLALIDLPPSRQTPQRPAAAREIRPAHAPAAGQRPVAAVPVAVRNGTHLIQLGSFATAEGARRAWRHYASRNPALGRFTNITTKVTVNGKSFWRVQASGFGGYASASSMCGAVKAKGGACLVMRGGGASQQGPQHAVETRMAKR